MINKLEMMDLVREFNFRNGFLLHGASMVMHGVKENTNDIDILIHTKAIEKIKFSSKKSEKFDFGFGMRRDTIDFVIIDGFQCQTLESIVKEKKKFGRPKDLEAVELINKFLSETGLPRTYDRVYHKAVIDY